MGSVLALFILLDIATTAQDKCAYKDEFKYLRTARKKKTQQQELRFVKIIAAEKIEKPGRIFKKRTRRWRRVVIQRAVKRVGLSERERRNGKLLARNTEIN